MRHDQVSEGSAITGRRSSNRGLITLSRARAHDGIPSVEIHTLLMPSAEQVFLNPTT
jgi:hypothetical protein